MGLMYMGAFADLIGDHEGYAARILPDGTETGTWSAETDQFTGYRASCECGWRSATVHPPTDAGEQNADDDWRLRHLDPLVDAEAARHTIRGDVLVRFMRDLARQANNRPRVDGDRFDGHAVGLCTAADELGVLLEELARERVEA